MADLRSGTVTILQTAIDEVDAYLRAETARFLGDEEVS